MLDRPPHDVDQGGDRQLEREHQPQKSPRHSRRCYPFASRKATDEVISEPRVCGLVAGGYRAIDALRLEKGYRVWAADITPDQTPLEAGLDFCVREDRSFVGADALRAPDRRLRCLVLEDPRSVALGNEPVRVGEEVCGRVTTGGYGYAVERSIAYAYLPVEHGV
ncbi:MAG TPA: glycine cleavage T C-terminal barrel domain-containing protein, partial [Solirubrobacteraceae bacterium]|nr:glycine cleavage T C-terminal barrel domain-containing protein [Solirubrobacteraceae bacterium]